MFDHINSPALLTSLFALALVACTPSAEPDEGPPPDAEQDSFLDQPEGKADAAFIEEMSWEALCVLKLVNTASLDVLQDAVHSTPAGNIHAYRLGPDGKAGTEDDVLFESLDQLDEVSNVGFFTFRGLSSYARERQESYCLAIGEEVLLPGEQVATEQISSRASLEVEKKFMENGIAHRDAHAKAHGCVKAFVEVTPDNLREEERVGVFQEAETYPAWIRFSNGSFVIQSDDVGDVRGMAIKLMGVPGEKITEKHRDQETVDFLLINGPTMFVRTPQDYVELAEKTFDGNPVTFFLSLNPAEVKWRELSNLLGIVNKQPRNPLQARYWSTTPYKLGEAGAVKYSAKPCYGEELKGYLDSDGPDLMRDSLGVHLTQIDGCFELMVQRQLDAAEMPIEDATVEWDEDDSPFITVARITVPMQEFDSPEQDEFCEHLSFNPWHTLPEHRPLGNINRARRMVYDIISVVRHDLNDAEEAEPTSHDLPAK